VIRAGILITGTEVLSGAVTDRNGPWLSRRLQEAGIEVAHICTVGDRRQDLIATLSMMRRQRLQLIVTSGGLGPTADDLTVAVLADHLGLPLVLDEALRQRIELIVGALARRMPRSREAFDAGNRKQATIPSGAIVLDPVGTAPGLVLDPKGSTADAASASAGPAPIVVVLPGPPRELQPMWADAVGTEPLKRLLAATGAGEIRTMRLFGIPESVLAETLRDAEAAGVQLARLEVTTCQHRGELEITTRVPEGESDAYRHLERFLAERHGEELFSRDGSTVDEQVANLLRGRETIAVAESCTGGMLAARLTDLAGSSEYVLGGIVAYSNEAKVALAGVPAGLIEAHGAVSEEVVRSLAEGARSRLRAGIGAGVTGIAGPGGATDEKPVGLVWIAVAGPGGAVVARRVQLPGGRAEVRERAVTVAMHMLRRALLAASAALSPSP
jgi:competence/damage-inducible protein CinA-like protein